MTIIADRITKAARARQFLDGYEPEWIGKAFDPSQKRDRAGKWTGKRGEAVTALREPDGSDNVNAHLRGKLPADAPAGGGTKLTVGEVADQMDAAIAKGHRGRKNEFPVVYRGGPLAGVAHPKVGKTYTEQGFASTSKDRDVADYFREENGGHTWAIRLPDDMKRLDYERAGLGGPANIETGPGHLAKEQEVVLPRGTRFKVKEVDPTTGRVHAEALPPERVPVEDARNLSAAQKIKNFEIMHGRPPTKKELRAAGMAKAAEFANADEQAKWDEAADATTLGALQPGDGFRLFEGSSAATHGTVTGAATGIGMVMVDTGTGNRYLPATTTVQATAAV
jgi:hypothetical protein